MKKVCFALVLCAIPASAPADCQAETDDIRVTADAKAPGTRLDHFWSVCVGAGRANEGLRAAWLDQLKEVHDACGFRYVRFHGLFHDDMFVVLRDSKGVVSYNWQYIDELFDRMLAIGVRPFVELSFDPIDPADPAGAQFWWKANAIPPRDLNGWSALIGHFARHCIERYGIGEVSGWYFEVWNEPNLQGFFHGGTQSQYFDLYRASAQILKTVDPRLRVGGPATSNFQVVQDGGKGGVAAGSRKGPPTSADTDALDWEPVWVPDFLAYCRDNRLPVDFVSTHPYPQDFPFDDGTGRRVKVRRGVGATEHDLKRLRSLVDSSPFPNAAIHLTEWSSSPSSRDFSHDCVPAAAFVVKTNLESAGLVDSLSYWTFTDVFEEKGGGPTIFHGGFGMINFQGIVKPTFHAYRFLNRLGDEVIARAPGVVVTRHSSDGRITALAYDYPSEVTVSLPVSGSLAEAERMQDRGKPSALSIDLTGLKPGGRVFVETLDRGHGNAVGAWESMGSPEPPTREQASLLRMAALATKREEANADASGRLLMRRTIEPWTVVLVDEQVD